MNQELMQLQVLSGGAAQGLVTALAPQFQAETGCDIAATFGAVGAMRDKLIGGASADLLILTSALIAELTKAGHVVAGSAADLGTITTGVAVRHGDPLPAVGDADALRAALRAADGIYFPDPKLATAGIHFAKVLERLGIADAVKSKLKYSGGGLGGLAGTLVGNGEAEIGVQQISELMAAGGVDIVGPLPAELQNTTQFSAGVPVNAKASEAGKALIAFLTTPAARSVLKAKGLEPN